MRLLMKRSKNPQGQMVARGGRVYLDPAKESISSINMTEGLLFLAISNRVRMSLADSPTHLETRSEEETESESNANKLKIPVIYRHSGK